MSRQTKEYDELYSNIELIPDEAIKDTEDGQGFDVDWELVEENTKRDTSIIPGTTNPVIPINTTQDSPTDILPNQSILPTKAEMGKKVKYPKKNGAERKKFLSVY